eukprot:gene4242-biopygen1545
MAREHQDHRRTSGVTVWGSVGLGYLASGCSEEEGCRGLRRSLEKSPLEALEGWRGCLDLPGDLVARRDSLPRVLQGWMGWLNLPGDLEGRVWLYLPGDVVSVEKSALEGWLDLPGVVMRVEDIGWLDLPWVVSEERVEDVALGGDDALGGDIDWAGDSVRLGFDVCLEDPILATGTELNIVDCCLSISLFPKKRNRI